MASATCFCRPATAGAADRPREDSSNGFHPSQDDLDIGNRFGLSVNLDFAEFLDRQERFIQVRFWTVKDGHPSGMTISSALQAQPQMLMHGKQRLFYAACTRMCNEIEQPNMAYRCKTFTEV